jgi:hypothetical protein
MVSPTQQYTDPDNAGGFSYDMGVVDGYDVSIPAGNTSFVFFNHVAGKTTTFILEQPGEGMATVTWPADVLWIGGTPSLGIANGLDTVAFYDNGKIWIGWNFAAQTTTGPFPRYLIGAGVKVIVPAGFVLLRDRDFTNHGTLINHGRIKGF